MKYGDEHLRKFKIGDTVRVRDDLIIGKEYFSEGKTVGDTFTSRMSKNMGREGRVIEYDYVGYKLNIDPIHTYTDEMLEKPIDFLAESEYTFNEDVEAIVEQSKLDFYQKRIDEALDSRMFETDAEGFKELVEEYRRVFDRIL